MEATAKYDYEASAKDELSFRREERLLVLQTSGNWYKAELNGREGFIPKNFINIHLPSWLQEEVSRGDAQQQLMQRPVGAFLLRGSRSTTRGDFSLSVRHPADVKHFKVLRDSRGQYFLWAEKFPSLNQLVEHYKHTSISQQEQLLLLEAPPPPLHHGSHHAPPLPPPPAPPSSSCPPPPAGCRQVKALYSFQAEEADELSFRAGDVIVVLECPDRAWWRGRVEERTGLFPSNYTQPV